MLLRGALLFSFGISLSLLLGSHHALADPTHYGSGAVSYDRLPWLDGASIVLTQGWGGCYAGRSHCPGNSDQYGTDWGPAGGGTFAIHAVAEREATCILEGGWGYRVRVDRSNDTLFDRYAHLPEPCPWSTYHLEQGYFISNAGCTGSCSGIHLHYQRENSSSQSQTFSLSGPNNFCDHDIPNFCTGSYDNDNFVSDNAGPGQGAGNPYIGASMAFTYQNVGHILCPPSNAWNCLGSSHGFWSGSRKATHNTLAGDGAWHQQFANWSGAWSDINAPDACPGKAYWVYHHNWFEWLNNTWLGQPRSSYFLSQGWWYQFFKNGVIVASSFGGVRTVYSGSYSCQ